MSAEKTRIMKSIKGIIFALISSGTFGLIPLFSIPILATGMGSPSILFYRFVMSSIVMGGICLLQRRSFKIPPKHLFVIFLLGLLYAATALLLILSYHYLSSGIATTIHFMYPILVSVIMVLFFKERKSSILFIAAILSVLGVVMLCWTGGEKIQLRGVFITSLTVITYASYIVGINKTEAGKINAEVLTFYILLCGAVIFLFAALFSGGIDAIPDTESFVRLVLLACFCTVISDLTLVMAIKLVGSTITSILGSMEPIVAVSVGVFVFAEPFSFYSFIGILLIILSVTLVVRKSSKPNKIRESEQKIERHQHIDA